MAKINNTGGLWLNKYKEAGDKRPDFTGEININGVTHKIAGWQNTPFPGKPVIALRVTPPPTNNPEAQEASCWTAPTKAVAVDLSDNKDDDIPF